MATFVLYMAGAFMLLIACELFMTRPVRRTFIVSREASDFVGDIQTWLRSENL